MQTRVSHKINFKFRYELIHKEKHGYKKIDNNNVF